MIDDSIRRSLRLQVFKFDPTYYIPFRPEEDVRVIATGEIKKISQVWRWEKKPAQVYVGAIGIYEPNQLYEMTEVYPLNRKWPGPAFLFWKKIWEVYA